MTTGDLIHDRYRLVEVLGQGAMGVVWRAHDSVLDREIALKELRPAPGVDPIEAKERFLVEARAAARLTHPNIVGIHDVFSDDERVLIAMELVEGPTLDELVRSGAQSPSVVRELMAQVAQALAVAHGQGVIHRDLKPDNIFWSNGRAVVADFGLARIGAGKGTVEGTVMGTPGYMSPEQVKGTATGPQTDVFGWAAVAYQLVAGIPPFGEPLESDITAMAYRVVHQDPPALDLPGDPDLAGLITRALAKDPAERPVDGAALVAGLTAPSTATEGAAPLAGEVPAAPEGSNTPTAAVGPFSDTGPSGSDHRESATGTAGEVPDGLLAGGDTAGPLRGRSRTSVALGIGAVLTILALFGGLMASLRVPDQTIREVIVQQPAGNSEESVPATMSLPVESPPVGDTTWQENTPPASGGGPATIAPPSGGGTPPPPVQVTPKPKDQPKTKAEPKPDDDDPDPPIVKAPDVPTIPAPTKANLRPTTISYDSSTAMVGSAVYFDSGIENAGGTDAGGFTIRWFVDGREVGAYGGHAGVPAGRSVLDGNSQFSWTFDTAGSYSVTFAVDADNSVAESNEGDNARSITLSVSEPYAVGRPVVVD